MTTPPPYDIVRCPSCDGYGWLSDEFSGEPEDCDWCRGTGYVYRDAAGVDRPIPEADYGRVSAILERLDHDRMHDLGYSGTALHPDEQPIRKRDADEPTDEV
jgi:hypothetical protein